MTQSPSSSPSLDQPLDGALGEVADQAVDRDAPALDHHPGLAGRHERDRVAGRLRGSPQLEGDRHLADRAVAADRQDHPLARRVPPARRPSPSARAAAGSRRSRVPRAAAAAANSGSSPMNVCRPERTSRPAAIASRMTVRHDCGSRPPVGAMPISSASGGGSMASASRASRRSGCRGPAGTRRRSDRPASNR